MLYFFRCFADTWDSKHSKNRHKSSIILHQVKLHLKLLDYMRKKSISSSVLRKTQKTITTNKFYTKWLLRVIRMISYRTRFHTQELFHIFSFSAWVLLLLFFCFSIGSWLAYKLIDCIDTRRIVSWRAAHWNNNNNDKQTIVHDCF